MKNITSFDTNTNYFLNNFYITIVALYIIAYCAFFFLLPVILPVSLLGSSVVFSACIGLMGLLACKIAARFGIVLSALPEYTNVHISIKKPTFIHPFGFRWNKLKNILINY